MSKFFYTACVFLISIGQIELFAQPYHDNVWVHADRDDALLIDFSSGNPIIKDIATDLVMDGASASICDAQGALAFYTNGCRVYNWRHELMENGEGLNPGEVYTDFCNPFDEFPRGYPTAPQSSWIVPWPGHFDQYLLLHLRIAYDYDPATPQAVGIDQLLYSLVDMRANNGEGTVVAKNVVVDSLYREPKSNLVRHANGNDWWYVNALGNSNGYGVYLIDSSGISFWKNQFIGLVDSSFNVAGDQLVFTPQGDQLVRFSVQQGLRLFDFDRFTGILSNFRHVTFPQGTPRQLRFGSVAVSPSRQYAYVNNELEVYQYDLRAEDIAGSQLLIAEMVDDGSMTLPPTVQVMQLGPDCKIYGYTVSGMNHHVIHYPDERGDACGWEQGGLPLGRYVFRDQPTFPNFRLGPAGEEGSPCAEPIVSVDAAPEIQEHMARVFPNPAGREVAFVVADEGVTQVALFDGLGRVVASSELTLAAGEIGRLALTEIPAGPYLLRLRLDDGRLVVRKLIINR